MSESKCTPGPWKVADMHMQTGMGMNDGAWAVCTVNDDEETGGRIALVDCQSKFKRGEGYKAACPTRDANARLIAASPALFETETKLCNEVSGALDLYEEGLRALMGNTNYNVLKLRCEEARSALAQAEGREQASPHGRDEEDS